MSEMLMTLSCIILIHISALMSSNKLKQNKENGDDNHRHPNNIK